MAAPTERRLAALEARLGDEGLPALLVSHPPDIRYLTGFSGTAGVLLARPGAHTLFTDFRYRDQAGQECPHVRVEVVQRDLWGNVWKAIKRDRPPREVGFDAGTVTVSQAQEFTDAGLPWTFRPTSALVAGLRERKDADEVEAIRAAAQLGLEALDAAWGAVAAGREERAIAGVLEGELRRRGSEAHPFPIIVASGPRSALPHARTSGRTLAVGDFLLVDFGATVDGYCADLTRTVVVGRPPDERQQRAYALVREAQQSALTGMRAGMRACDADALARHVIASAGFGDAFGHALGHGLGLEVHEAPRLGQGSEAPLPAGAVVTVEPGVYFAGWGGVRLEDDVHLTADGVDILSGPAGELMTLG